jgi:flagellar secretion chaperone FliS
MYRNGFQNYSRARVDTADPKRLVILCYEEMISQIKMARQRCVEKDYEGKSKALLKAQDIVCELQCALDFEKGGVIATNLDSLYNYVKTRMVQADMGKDLATMDEVTGILSELKSAWEEAFRSLERDGAPSHPAPEYEGERRVLGAAAF